MRSVYLLFLCLIGYSIVSAQSPCNEDINSSGVYFQHPSGINNTWSIGSAIVGEMLSEDSTYLICNGFVPLPCSFGQEDPCANRQGPDEQQPLPISACIGETVNLSAPVGYSYVWGDGTQASNYNVTESGLYQLTISDGCEQVLTYEVTFLPLPNISFQTVDPTDCGANNGMIILSFTNIDNGNYNLTYKGGVFNNVAVNNNSATISGLTPGIYNYITISNEAGCTATTDGLVEITESGNTLAQPVLGTSSTFCESNNVESITVTGVPFASFTWYADIYLTNVLNRGAYYLTSGTDETVYVTQQVPGSCESEGLEVKIVFNQSTTLSSKSYEVCADEIGANHATIDLTNYETEIGNSTGTWTNDEGIIAQPNSYLFSDQANLEYTFEGENGCTAITAVKIKVTPVESKSVFIDRCTFETGNLINIMAVAVVNGLPDNGTWISNEIEIEMANFYLLYEPLQNFNYNYTDENGCANRLVVDVLLEQAPQMQTKVICNGAENFDQYFIEVVLTKNVTYNDVVVTDGNTTKMAAGSGIVTFGPYTHSGTGLNTTVIEAYFSGTTGCRMIQEVAEKYCPELEACDCSNGGNAGNILALSESESQSENGFIPYYILTNESGNILNYNNTGLFKDLDNNNYQVYTILVNPADSDALSNGLSSAVFISAFTQNVPFMNLEYSISEPNTYEVNCDCVIPATCTDLTALEISDKVCEGNTFDVSVESSEANTGVVAGYYNGIVALPDPYNNPPDELFNDGNAIIPQNGVIELTGVGANLSNGFYTIVAYVENSVNDGDCQPMVRKFTEIYDTPQINPVAEPICAGNTGVLISGVSEGSLPYSISWTDPAGETYPVQNFTVHLASDENAGTYSVSVVDSKACTASSSVSLEVIEQENASYLEVSLCESVPGGALEANISLNEYEAMMSTAGGIWRDRSGNTVSASENISLSGTSQFEFDYLIETQGNCSYKQVLIITIKSALSCGNLPVTSVKGLEILSPTLNSDDDDEKYDILKREIGVFQLDYLLPNPTTGQLYFGINISDEGKLMYEIYDATGKIMDQVQQFTGKGFVAFDLDVSTYNNGIYLLKIIYDDHYVHQKFIKQ